MDYISGVCVCTFSARTLKFIFSFSSSLSSDLSLPVAVEGENTCTYLFCKSATLNYISNHVHYNLWNTNNNNYGMYTYSIHVLSYTHVCTFTTVYIHMCHGLLHMHTYLYMYMYIYMHMCTICNHCPWPLVLCGLVSGWGAH